jgi:hypothetical protein
MSLATITLVDAETLDAVVGLLEAQLREHEIERRAMTRARSLGQLLRTGVTALCSWQGRPMGVR